MKGISGQRLLINEITNILQKNSRNSWKVCTQELNGFNISSEVEVRPAAILDSPPPALSEIDSDGVEVPESHDQEFEEQNSVFGPQAYQFLDSDELVGMDSSHINTSRTSKRRRTSEVRQYFDEVREDGEVWAKCRSCSTKYRGESTRELQICANT
ncbi:hypothetical protein POTOM_053301 [Populus tomentosa]|uniref:BED-type domain-containing protein n=1 Tax=Populus tomentosa TaxID=118781 RepID=A0A8X8C638_POPTO|nr:hypothetical protein POTOM_053301 [Populus tomentosa]